MPSSERSQHYALIGLPLLAKLDRSDDLLNPTSGYRLQGNLVPVPEFLRPRPDLCLRAGRRQHLSAARQQRPLHRRRVCRRLVDPGRSLPELPADKRIYAGGGGSVRAYGYQMAGPLDANNNPIGGRSSLELSLEARIKITQTIGIVPFFDAGSYYTSPVPQLGKQIFYGPGLGLRYYTPFGPVRLDIATPLRRRSADSPVQLYISLGQAF